MLSSRARHGGREICFFRVAQAFLPVLLGQPVYWDSRFLGPRHAEPAFSAGEGPHPLPHSTPVPEARNKLAHSVSRGYQTQYLKSAGGSNTPSPHLRLSLSVISIPEIARIVLFSCGTVTPACAWGFFSRVPHPSPLRVRGFSSFNSIPVFTPPRSPPLLSSSCS